MSCTACTAPTANQNDPCPICGYEPTDEQGGRWTRQVQATLYEDLSAALEPAESLLGATRGKIAGCWRGRFSLDPSTMLSPFANLGLTSQRLIVQPIQVKSGRAGARKPTSLPLDTVRSVAITETEAFEPGTSLRLVITSDQGDALRIRAAGKLAKGARDLAEVWQSLAGMTASTDPDLCRGCEARLDRQYRYCPYCGKPQGEG